MEGKIKKFMILFLSMMILFTIVSRAAASILVAEVQTDHYKRGELKFQISGTGIVKDHARKYIELLSGLRMEEVMVEEGQQVEKGDLLLIYDLKQLREKKKSMEEDLKKSELQYEKAKIADAEIIDGEEVKEAVQKKEEANDRYQDALSNLNEVRQSVSVLKEKEYQDALSAYDEVKAQTEASHQNAIRAVADAQEAYEDCSKPLDQLEQVITQYQSAVSDQEEEQISEARVQIYDFYYQGKYEKHQEEVQDAKNRLDRAMEDQKEIVKKWDLAINPNDQYTGDEYSRKEYATQILNRESELKKASREIADAQDTLNRLTKVDKQLDAALGEIKENPEESVPLDLSKTTLYQFIYQGIKIDERKITQTKLQLDRAKEDESRTLKEGNRKRAQARKAATELSAVLQAIDQGNDSGVEALKQAEQTRKDAERELKTSEDTIEMQRKKNQKDRKSSAYDLEILQMELDQKREGIDQLEDLIAQEGKIFSPVAGSISKLELESGTLLSGQEKLMIATGSFELLMKADKEELNYFRQGDEVRISDGNNSNKLISQIEHMELPDQDGMMSFTAVLPEGEYIIGSSLAFELSKNSDNYPICIPMEAIRQDNSGTFVLLVKEYDSVLGKEERAFRMNITILAKDGHKAAVEASFSENDQIICGSNKNISEGDRVRIHEME